MNGFERRKELKKNNILEASLHLFMKDGMQNVSVSKIAKEADVSQVTIYNYFGSKNDLTEAVLIYYVDHVWKEYKQWMDSDLPFLEKIKKIIFEKTATSHQINEEFLAYFMKEYTGGNRYLVEFYQKTVFPGLIEFFNEGKEQGYIDSELSSESILIFIKMFTSFIQQEGNTKDLLPMTEELTKLFFYGIVGKGKE